MGRIFHPLLALLASATRQELARQVAYLKEENRILRARLPERIVATPQEKKRLLRAGRRLGAQLKELMSFVSYQTFRRWIREAEEDDTKSKPASNRKPGRPRTPEEVRDLIIQMRKDTGFGYTKLMGELRKLGCQFAGQTGHEFAGSIRPVQVP